MTSLPLAVVCRVVPERNNWNVRITRLRLAM